MLKFMPVARTQGHSNFSDFGRSSQLLNGQGLPKVPKNSSEKLRISDDWSSLENAKLANFHLPQKGGSAMVQSKCLS